ncbi:hypothetical protein GCM10007086_14190 [Photobacterium aphoticum]|nr:hypothetical protein GCM10007086_14190 [Photobacterium aphoticum]
MVLFEMFAKNGSVVQMPLGFFRLAFAKCNDWLLDFVNWVPLALSINAEVNHLPINSVTMFDIIA